MQQLWGKNLITPIQDASNEQLYASLVKTVKALVKT
ncbi:MAG: hypothetical protein RL017_431, partial [Pseudomonadota bacterium]